MSYIEISTTGAIGGALRYAVRYDAIPGGYQTPVQVEQTLDGTRVLSFGVSKRRWKYTAVVDYSAPTALYGSLAQIEALFSNNTISLNQLVFRDFRDSTVYSCILLNKANYEPRPISPQWYDARSKWEVEIELGQV